MSILIILLLGAIVGWFGAKLAGREEGIIGCVAIGIVGAFIGSILAKWVTASSQSYLSFSWSGFLWSLLGAIIFSGLLNALQHK
jgi:uncharacterized membrane protein YeaQ/YmgE (transglycosylase-associated protein family)